MTPILSALIRSTFDEELRRARSEGRGEPLKRGLRVAVRDDGVGQALKHGVVEIAVLELDLHGEAADVADALNRRRRERECERFRHALQGAVEAQGDRADILPRLLEAHVPILEDDEGDAGVGEARQVVEDGDAADGDHMLDARDFAGDPLDLLHDRVRALLRGAIGQLRGDDQVALVLGRQKGGGHARQPVDGDSDERKREDDHGAGAAGHCADEPCVSALGGAVDDVEAAREKVALLGRLRRPEPQRGLRGLEGECVHRADEGGGRDDQRELPVKLSCEPRHKSSGNEHRHQDQRDAEDRPGQVVHRPGRRLAAGDPLLDVSRDAFDDDDRVVDDDSDRQHEGEQCREIDRKAEGRHGGEGADERHRHGGRRNEHRAPVLQEDENDDQHQNGRLDQRAINFVDRGPHEIRRVVGDAVDEALREALGELVHFRFHLVGDRNRVGVRQERDGDAGGRSAVEIERLAVGLGAELGVANVADSGDLSAVRRIDLDDDILELGGIVEAASEI